MRVAGFALELAFRVGHFLGLWELGPPRVALVKVKKVSMGRPENHPRAVECSVAEVHQRAVIKATEDIMPRLTKSGYAIVDVCVSQKGHDAAHDLVLEYRTPGTPCRGQYAGELKLRTSPAHRTAMRKDCASLFKAACDDSDKWLSPVDHRGRSDGGRRVHSQSGGARCPWLPSHGACECLGLGGPSMRGATATRSLPSQNVFDPIFILANPSFGFELSEGVLGKGCEGNEKVYCFVG